MATHDVTAIVTTIATRSPARPEAQLQAEIYKLLTLGALDLDTDDVAKIEVQTGDGTRQRIDVEVGHCCIEVKKDLRNKSILDSARGQLAGYVEAQSKKYGTRYVGILTDGVEWHLCRLAGEGLEEVTVFTAHPERPDELLSWLEAVLAMETRSSSVAGGDPPAPRCRFPGAQARSRVVERPVRSRERSA